MTEKEQREKVFTHLEEARNALEKAARTTNPDQGRLFAAINGALYAVFATQDELGKLPR